MQVIDDSCEDRTSPGNIAPIMLEVTNRFCTGDTTYNQNTSNVRSDA